MSATHTPIDLAKDLETRRILKQMTDPELPRRLNSGPLTVYAGFDPTADCLHVGNLLPLLTLRRFQLAGHQPIAVVGGATGMIGDPGGKSQERQLLNDEQIKHNLIGITAVVSKFLDLEGPRAARILNNADWFQGVSYIDFLRDVGKHFTVNHMIAKESVRARLEDREHGISYTEFSYMLLQAYDFYVLNQREGCTLQIGGSDQWGNITAGIELIRRMQAAQGKPPAQVYGLTHELVTKSDGSKFGKSEGGAIWLDARKTSPFQFYQFFIQSADADVATYLKYFSFLSIEEIASLEHSLKTQPEKRDAQQALARELTRMTHGESELKGALAASNALFGAEIRDLNERTLLDVLAGAPQTTKPKSALEGVGFSLVDALVETGLCSSKGNARKDLGAGGIYVNNSRATSDGQMLVPGDLIAGAYIVLRKGKRNYHLLAFR